MKKLQIVACLVFLLALPLSLAAQQSEDWADSPEAYFLTPPEKDEWKGLESPAERDAFKNRYWLRRDPTPQTPQNEFRDVILGRIKRANELYKIGSIEGARSARGFAYVVFGPPSRFLEQASRRPTSDAGAFGPNPPRIQPTGGNDGLESVVLWKYERDRTPKILEVLGRPNLDLVFYIEPERHRDRFETEGLPRELAAIVAQKSIVNSDVRASASTPAPAAVLRPIPSTNLMTAALPTEAAAALVADANETRVRFGYASLLDKREVTAWFFVPDAVKLAHPKIVGTLAGPEATNALSLEPAATNELLASEGGRTYGVRFAMPAAGAYSASFALMDGLRPVANGRVPKLLVPASTGSFEISNIVLTGGVEAPSSQNATFGWGDVQIQPRADSTFRLNESLWYFVQVANPADPEKLVIDVRLRRANAPHGEPVRALAGAGKVSDNIYLIGRELPLLSLEPGTYSLYVTVIDGTSEKVSRADFTVAGPNS
jgi:GWxTD domain-containing protein